MASASGGLLRYADAAATLDAVYHLGSFTETWFKSIIISLSSLWLILRVYQVFLKPVGELIALLGLEVPAQPNASLAGIKADGVTLHWKLGDNTVTKWQITINGIGVGELGPKETSVTLYGLQPEQSYTARLVAHNAHFQTASPPVRFTTLPASSNLFYQEARDEGDVDETDQPQQQQLQHPRHPMLKPAKALFDPIQVPSAQPMVREHSSSLSQRRNTQARRVSPILTDIATTHAGDDNTSEAVRDLTSKLDILRRDNEEAERQEREEQDEFESSRTALEDERDRYRKMLKEKDDTSRDLKKEVTRLERANTSVQGGKNTAERKLQHKLNDRQKMKDDISRWDREVEEMKLAVQRLLEQKELLEEETEAKLDAYRDQLAKSQESNKSLEEDIKDTSMQIKSLEQEKRKNSDGEVDAAQQAPDALDEEERAFEGRLRSLQSRYTEAWNNMIQAEATYQNCQRHLMFLGQQRRQSTSQAFAPASDAPRRRTSNGPRQTVGNVSDMPSSASPAFGTATSQPPNHQNTSNVSPNFPNMSTPFFNMTNGMTYDPEQLQQTERDEMTEAERAELTAGAPMSPSTAGALLPSNLFGDEAASSAISDVDPEARIAAILDSDVPRPSYATYRRIISDDASSLNQKSNRNSAALPGLGAIPGLGAAPFPTEATENRDPSSPTSADSRSPSLYASPRASTNNLPHKDSFNEIDRRSIRSNTNSSLGPKGRSRFFDGLTRLGHRAGKASQDEGPALGSLSNSQTRSMPRQELSDQNANDPKRRGSHTGSGWMGMPSISQAFSRSGKEADTGGVPGNEMPRQSKLRPFSFGKSGGGDPWLASSLLSRSTGPRPSSTHSSENANMLPRPETGNESRFGWPIEAANMSERQLISPLSVDWATQDAPSWSRQPSRRPSVQYGPAPFGPEIYHDGEIAQSHRSPMQAPIGTRPQTSHGQGSGSASGEGTSAPATPDQSNAKPSLNPAAPSFSLSFLSRSKKTDDGEGSATLKSEKKKDKKGKGRDKDAAEASAAEMTLPILETPKADAKDSSSPPESRKSRDNRSISTADGSFLDSSVASMPRSSLEQTRSHTPSESQSQLTPLGSRDSTSAKESFMQKLSRKTSQTGSKLSRPFSFTARKSTATTSPALEGRDSTPTPDEWDEDFRKSIDSTQFAPPSASSAANSPLIRPSFDGGAPGNDDIAENGRKERTKAKGASKGWGSLKLTSRREKKKADGTDAEESVTASEVDTADEDGE